jgi:hypothetical protein
LIAKEQLKIISYLILETKMSDISSGFPKPLAFNYLKRLQGNFSKNNIKIIPDNQTAQPNNVVRLKVGGNGLFDFRSFQLMMTGTCKQDNVGANDYRIHFPRYASSLIQDMVITANNTTLFSCKDYNYLYNAIHDLEASDISQYAKRNTSCENYDPSIAFGVSSYTETDGGANQTLSAIPAMLTTAPSDTNMPLCVNNWLFFNSLSVPIIDLSMIGDVYITITFAPASVLWRGSSTTATPSTALSNPTYTLTNIYATIDRIQFSDPTYYQFIASKLLGEGVFIGYYDYYFSSFSSTKKKNGIALNWTVNSPSLDKVYLTFKHKLATDGTVYPLVLWGANQNANAADPQTTYKTFPQLIADYALHENDGGGTDIIGAFDKLGDYFNNSVYFVRSGAGFSSSKWSVNSVDIDTFSLTLPEIFQKYLKSDNHNQLDAGAGCVYAGCPSIYHFGKYFFVDCLDLSLQTGNDPDMYVSGLNGSGSGISIAYNATFDSAADATVTPVSWCRSTTILKIKAGRQLQINPPVVY